MTTPAGEALAEEKPASSTIKTGPTLTSIAAVPASTAPWADADEGRSPQHHGDERSKEGHYR
jgi:hypothetical protein